MRKVVYCVVGLVGGYLIGAILGAVAVEVFSTNSHDKSVESAMTGAFVTGPAIALVGLIAGWIRAARTSRPN